MINKSSSLQRKVCRPPGQTDAVKLKGALGYAIDNVIAASTAGDVNASIALLNYSYNREVG